MQNKIYELIQKKETQNLIKNLTSKSGQLLRKIDKTNEDYLMLINEIKNYKKPKFLLYGNNSLLNILKNNKEGKKLLFKNEYGLIANLLNKYKDNLDNNLYEYIKIKDKIRILKYIQNKYIEYILKTINKDEIDIDILNAIISTESKVLRIIKLEPINNDLKEVLHKRYNLYFKDETDYYSLKKLKEFYQDILYNKNIILKAITSTDITKLLENYDIYTIISILITLPDNIYNLLEEYYLIAPLIKYIKDNKDWNNDIELITKLCKEDINCYLLASLNLKSNKEFILYILSHRNKSSIDEDILIDNISINLLNDLEFNKQLVDKLTFTSIEYRFLEKDIITDKLNYLYLFKNNDNINKDKSLITKLIYKTPKSFKYIDKSLIDIPLVEYLLNNFRYNDKNPYYTNFYNDIRFNKFYNKNKNKLISKEKDIIEEISKYIELKKRPNSNVYVGLCPFHDDHNPSLKIYPDKNKFVCYSCCISGNINSLIQQLYINNTYIDTDDEYYDDFYEYRDEEYNKYDVLGQFKKNRFYYYLYANLPIEIKYNIDIIKKFLSIDGCILKLVPKELRYNNSLVEIAMNQDISSFRYIMNDQIYKDKYIKLYPILNYYLPKKEKSKDYLDYIKYLEQEKNKIKEYYASFEDSFDDYDLPF